MLRIPLKKARPGMILARHIYNSNGKVLLAAGVQLEEHYIKRLKALGISSIYIHDKYTDGIEFIEAISEETRLRAESTVVKVFQETRENRKLNVKAIYSTTEHIINEILKNKNALVNLAEVRAYDNYTFAHSVNVCVLSVITGASLGFNKAQLRDLGIGALLHDIGKTQIDPALLNKVEPLNDHEFEAIKKHPHAGFEILRQAPEISLLSAHVAFQHHERLDGSGYPRGLKGKEIHPYAMITTVADIYDALVSDRPYRLGIPPHQALDMIAQQAAHTLDPEIISAFTKNIAPYPVTTPVQLNTGEIGIVVDVNKNYRHRPVVRVIFDSEFKELPEYREVDLSKNKDLYVAKVLTPGEFPFASESSPQVRREDPFTELRPAENKVVKDSLV